jgi:PAB-dependent poly(A)-specific ribonuclease subunit 3
MIVLCFPSLVDVPFLREGWFSRAFNRIGQHQVSDVLRCCAGFRLANEKAMAALERWKKMSHPNIVSLRECFTTKDFGDSCMRHICCL